MQFNFHEQYQKLPTTELLKIVRNADQYQPEAVAVAAELLEGRDVSEKDLEEVTEYFNEAAVVREHRSTSANDLKRATLNFFGPIANPPAETKTAPGHNIFIFALIVLYQWTFYKNFAAIVGLFRYANDCGEYQRRQSGSFSGYLDCFFSQLDSYILAFILPAFYIPFVMYLFFQRRKWGWILIFGDLLFSLIFSIRPLLVLIVDLSLQSGTGFILLRMAFSGAILYFLCQKKTLDFFNVTEKARNITALVVAGITLTMMLLIAWMSP